MKPYEQLRTLRNEMLYPDGVPLEFGCKIKFFNYFKKEEISTVFSCEDYDDNLTRENASSIQIDAIDSALDSDLVRRNIFTPSESDDDYKEALAMFRYKKIRMIEGRIYSNANMGVQKEIIDDHLYNNVIEILGKPVTVTDVLQMLQKKYECEEKDCLNWHTNKYMQLSISLSEFGDKIGFLDVDLTKEIKDQEESTIDKLIDIFTNNK